MGSRLHKTRTAAARLPLPVAETSAVSPSRFAGARSASAGGVDGQARVLATEPSRHWPVACRHQGSEGLMIARTPCLRHRLHGANAARLVRAGHPPLLRGNVRDAESVQTGSSFRASNCQPQRAGGRAGSGQAVSLKRFRVLSPAPAPLVRELAGRRGPCTDRRCPDR